MRLALGALALVALQVVFAAPAAAAVDEQTVKALIERIEAQEARIAELEKANEARLAELGKAEGAETKAGAPAVVASAPVPAPAPALPFKIETKGGLKIESPDGKNSFSFGGRIQVDAAQYSNDRDTAGNDVFGNGTAFRRVRFDVKGKIQEDWGYRVQYDFADIGPIGLKDAYISFDRYEPWKLQIGQFFQPFGLERQTSSNNITFLERAMPTNAITPDRAIGIALATGGTLGDGKLGDFMPFWTAKSGVFGMRAQDDTNSVANGADESIDLTGRVTIAPLYNATQLVQLGASFRRQETNDASAFTRFRALPEVAVSQFRLVDTGDLSGGTGLVRDFSQFGVDLATLWARSRAQGEWMKTNVDRGGGLSNPSFDGGYGQVSWLLTGETRGFKPADAVHEKVKPKRNFGDDGWGAWEVAARYSTLDLSDAGVIGGKEDNLTLGLNWYPNESLRFMANYIRVLDLDRPGNVSNDVEPNILVIRSQVVW